MKRAAITSLLIIIGYIWIFPQQISDALREVFIDAEYFLVEEDYVDALVEYEKIYKRGYKDNANINYRMGICYLHLPGEKDKSIPYLEKAIKNVSDNYSEGSLKETYAPYDALLYLGNAYRVNNQLDKACSAYNKYMELDKKSIESIDYAKKQIDACKVAKVQMQKPVTYTIENIGVPVNDKYSNFKAVLSADESRIIYVTQLKFYDAVFFSEKKENTWSEPVNFTPQIESDGDQYPCFLSPDGNTLLLSKEDFYNSDIYISYFSEGVWSKSKSIGKKINTKYWESHACISPDGNTIYFASNRKGGLGAMDIYYAKKTDNGEWGEPLNIGVPINTDLNDDTPFILEDGETLYFSSQGHNNMGGYDVFYTTLNDDGTWSEPKNIGYPVNTTDDDLFLMPVGEGNTLYTAKLLEDGIGQEDIYRLQILSEAEAAELIAQEGGTEEIEDTLGEIEVVEETEIVEQEIEEPEERVVLRPIYFDFDKYNLDATAKQKLDYVSEIMKEYSSLKLLVIGHTDSKGSYEYNKILSEKRATSTANYIISKGISSNRLKMKGQSESNPVAINASADGSDCPEGRKLNRRVEFRLIESEFDNITFEKNEVPDNLKIK